jgi:hypothetical protein
LRDRRSWLPPFSFMSVMPVRRKKVVKSPWLRCYFDFYIKICYNIYVR